MTIAESCDGSSPARSIRRSVSRQEMPASIRMLALELERTAVLPRDPDASTVMRTMERRIVEKPVDSRVIIWLTVGIEDLRRSGCNRSWRHSATRKVFVHTVGEYDRSFAMACASSEWAKGF